MGDVAGVTLQEQLRDAVHWAVAGRYCGLKQQDAMIAAADRIDALEAALRDLMNELGVPGPNYPAPVANAYDIARAARESSP